MFESSIKDGVLQLRRPGTRWLSTGWDGGFLRSQAAYNVSVPDGWDRTDIGEYAEARRQRAGFTAPGPSMLTGVDLEHARGARADPVVVYATAGLSNPADLPMSPADPSKTVGRTDGDLLGTVNLIVGTERALDDGALASLLSVVVEAKTTTLLRTAGFPGTTTDAAVVGCDPTGEPAVFAGSATPVGSAARACVREAVRASLTSRYAERSLPESVADAEYGVTTSGRAEVFQP